MEVGPDHASSHGGEACCAYALHAQHFLSAFNQLAQLTQLQLNAVTTMSSGLYTYLQQLTAAVELTSRMPPVALHVHNECQKPFAH